MTFDAGTIMTEWALGAVAAAEEAPRLAVRALLDEAEREPQSLVLLRRNLERADPATWNAIKRGHIHRQIAAALSSRYGSAVRRVHVTLSRQSVTSHLHAILTPAERDRMAALSELMRAALRVRPLGPEGIQRASAKAIKSRSRSAMLALLRQTASSARLVAVTDSWLTRDPERLPDTGFVDAILTGLPEALLMLSETREFAPGDWRWRVLFGSFASIRDIQSNLTA